MFFPQLVRYIIQCQILASTRVSPNGPFSSPMHNSLCELVFISLIHLLLQESCRCVVGVAEACPPVFHQQSESLATPLFRSMTHQHSKVRTACVKVGGYYVTSHVTHTCGSYVLWHIHRKVLSSSAYKTTPLNYK